MIAVRWLIYYVAVQGSATSCPSQVRTFFFSRPMANAKEKVCGCACGIEPHYDLEVPSQLASGLRQCECRLCGPGRCSVRVHPMLFLSQAFIQKGSCAASISPFPILCDHCGEHFLLQQRREAVRRARCKRKRDADATAEQERIAKLPNMDKGIDDGP